MELYLGRGSTRLIDHHTSIHHAKPNCNSHEFIHGILDGKCHRGSVLTGKIFTVAEQKTDAKQTNPEFVVEQRSDNSYRSRSWRFLRMM